MRAAPRGMSASAANSGAAASATSGLWKAAATGSCLQESLRLEQAAAARSISALLPDRTAWEGALRLAITRSSRSSLISSSRVASGAETASMLPLSPFPAAISRPRRRERAWKSCSSSTPAAHRAVSSP